MMRYIVTLTVHSYEGDKGHEEIYRQASVTGPTAREGADPIAEFGDAMNYLTDDLFSELENYEL